MSDDEPPPWKRRRWWCGDGGAALPPAFSLPLPGCHTERGRFHFHCSHPSDPADVEKRHKDEHTRSTSLTATMSSLGAMMQQQLPALASQGAGSGALVAAGARTDRGGPAHSSIKTGIYHPLSIDVDGVEVPVAVWHPCPSLVDDKKVRMMRNATYRHRISLKKIGRLLAGWNLPALANRGFGLQPHSDGSIDVQTVTFPGHERQFPSEAPFVLLAHGYLGSRFDLSHIGEVLASEGFLAAAPEYPESLSASYDAADGCSGPIDRTAITDRLLEVLTTEWGVRPTSYGVVGHSLGCVTADAVGDASWTRVCLAGGRPPLRGPKCLFVASVGDGAAPASRSEAALRDGGFVPLDEDVVRSRFWGALSPRSYLMFRDPETAPCHISFLAEGTNDAMVEFLAPLLPLARALGVPVLDFDKYGRTRDSRATADVVVPLVVDYMKQMMGVS